jgi:hypothetical protein
MQSPQVGALAAVRAATDPDTSGGGHNGPPRPSSPATPVRVGSSAGSDDTAAGRRLCRGSERPTGVVYPVAEPTRDTSRPPSLRPSP